jgi:hypothetical protein
LGFPTGWLFTTHEAYFLAPLPGTEVEEAPTSPHHQQDIFWRRCRGGSRRLLRGEFLHAHPLLSILFCFTLFYYLHCFIKKPKKIESLVVVISLLLVIMLFPKYVLEDLSVGSGSIVGKDNIEEFFNHISMHKEV